jgi:quercetin dioxygenase-like cupin family protein
VILEGEGWLELDGERIPVKPLSAITIRPGCRHRAVGKMKVLNFVVPAFDPEDEWFD